MDSFNIMIKKYENIQALRGIAVLGVVLFHLMGFDKQFFPAPHILSSLFNLGCSGVDLFFVISGFVMVIVTHNRFGNLAASGHFIYHRITRIYPLYWLFAIVLLLAHFFLLHEPVNIESGYVWKSLFLLPQKDQPFLPPAWTLIHEMYFYVVMMFFLLVPQKKLTMLLAMWAFVTLAGNIFLRFDPKFSVPSLALIFNPLTWEFIAGCLVGYLICQNKLHFPRLFSITGILLFFIGCLYSFKYLTQPDLHNALGGWLRVLCFGIPAAFVLYAVTVFEYQNKLFPNFLRNMGNYSYSIYLSHIMILSAALKIFNKLHTQNVYVHGIFLIVAFIGILIVGKYSYLYLEKPILKFSRKGWKILSPQAIQNEN